MTTLLTGIVSRRNQWGTPNAGNCNLTLFKNTLSNRRLYFNLVIGISLQISTKMIYSSLEPVTSVKLFPLVKYNRLKLVGN